MSTWTRFSAFFAFGAALSVAYACSADDAGPSGAIVGTVLDSGPGALTPVVSLARESEGASAVAATTTEIVWVAGHHTIRAATKAAPTSIRTVADRPGSNILALVADDRGIYWVESGGEVMAARGGNAPDSLYAAGGALDRLALGGATLALVGPNDAGVVTVGTRGDPPETVADVVPDDRGLANDGTSVFVTRGGADIVRLGLVGGGIGNVIVGLSAPGDLAVDSSFVYTSADVDGGRGIFKVDKTGLDIMGDAAVASTLLPLAPDGGVGAILLSHDGTNLVYANRGDGTIVRVLDGGATLIATVTGGLNAMVADRDGVYWSSDDGVVVWAPR